LGDIDYCFFNISQILFILLMRYICLFLFCILCNKVYLCLEKVPNQENEPFTDTQDNNPQTDIPLIDISISQGMHDFLSFLCK